MVVSPWAVVRGAPSGEAGEAALAYLYGWHLLPPAGLPLTPESLAYSVMGPSLLGTGRCLPCPLRCLPPNLHHDLEQRLVPEALGVVGAKGDVL